MPLCTRRVERGKVSRCCLMLALTAPCLMPASLSLLSPLALPVAQTPELGGVGGKVSAVFIQTRLSFTRDDGKRVTVQGLFGVFTDLTSSDVSVLGRDVTNNFAVIYSYPKRRVTLLAPPHDYQIQP
jgi:hypothetical protein